MSCIPTNQRRYANPLKQISLLECVDQILWKNIIPVSIGASVCFHSRLFRIPKPGKKNGEQKEI